MVLPLCSTDGECAFAGCKSVATESRAVYGPGVITERVLCTEWSCQDGAKQQQRQPLPAHDATITNADATTVELPSTDVAADLPELSR